MRAKIVESFGEQNDAGKHCLDEDDLGWLFMCVAGFTATQQIYQTMGVDPQGAMDWDDSFESMNGLHRFMAARLIAKCPDMAEADCVARELAVMLAVTSDEARYCVCLHHRRDGRRPLRLGLNQARNLQDRAEGCRITP